MEKGDSRWQPQEKKVVPNPDDRLSAQQQEACSRGDQSQQTHLTSADGDQAHRSNNVPQWFERSDLRFHLLGSARHRSQFGVCSSGDQSQRSSGSSTGSGKPQLTARSGNRRNRIPHDSQQLLTSDHGNWLHRGEDHIEKFGRNGESSRADDWCLRRDGRDHLERSESLSESQNWRLARKNKSSDQESSRCINWRRRSDHLDRLGTFSKAENWRDTTTFKSSGQEISRCNSWRFKVEHERHHLDGSDPLCNSQNWRDSSSNKGPDQESSWYKNWRFKGDHERDQQKRSEDLHETRANRRSGPRSNSEWRDHQSKSNHRNSRPRNGNALKRGEDASNCQTWHASDERTQLVQKILNLDSETWQIRPDRYRSDCSCGSEKWPPREHRDRNQPDRLAGQQKLDAREAMERRLVPTEMEKVTVENNITSDLTRLLRGETSNQQLAGWIEVG